MDMTCAPHGALATAHWCNLVTESRTFNNCHQAQTIQVGSQKTYLQTYSYDDFNRLTRVDEATQAGGGNSWWMSFDYGRYGNRWVSGASNGVALHAATATAQSQYDESKNQLIKQSNGQNLPGNAHDAAGNLQNHPELGVMIFDGQNRLVCHTASGGVVNMFYDAEGRRVKKTSPNGTVHYIYGPGGQLWAEDGGAGWPGTATRRFLTSDTLGSTRLVTDSTGVVKERRDYHPFGEEIPASTVFGSRHNVTDGGVTSYNEAALVTQRFTGKERDAETGLDYFGARYMSAAQGRFMSPDVPLLDQHPGDPQSWNLYGYVRNNPLVNIDPDGRICIFGFGTCNEKNPPPPDAPAAPSVPQGAPGSATFNLVTAQDKARTNPANQPEATGERRTFCNFSVCQTAQALGAPMEPLRTTVSIGDKKITRNATANEINANLPNATSYREVTQAEAQSLANEGKLVIAVQPAGGHGHVTTVRPTNTYFEQGTSRSGTGPLQNHIGRTVGVVRESLAFSRTPSPRYFTPVLVSK
jgi:RHS repeat-associated protein